MPTIGGSRPRSYGLFCILQGRCDLTCFIDTLAIKFPPQEVRSISSACQGVFRDSFVATASAARSRATPLQALSYIAPERRSMRLFFLFAFISVAIAVVSISNVASTSAQTGVQEPASQPVAPAGVGIAPGSTAIPQPAGSTTPVAPANEPVYRQQVSYMLGRNIGADLRENQIECDLQSLMAGISDAMRGAEPKWSEEQLGDAMAWFEQQMKQKAELRMQQMQQQGAQNQQQAAAFLAANKQKEGVQTTASGLQYRIIKEGNGPSPTLTDTVRCHYRGVLLDGTEFDSSLGGEPIEFPVNGVIPGWTEALQKMKVGDKWQLFVPANLAYGPRSPGPPIEPNSMLIFEVELLGIQ